MTFSGLRPLPVNRCGYLEPAQRSKGRTMNFLWKALCVIAVGSVMAVSVTGCSKPSVENQPPVADSPHPDIAPAKPNPTSAHPDIK